MSTIRSRREPPAFRRTSVTAVDVRSSRLVRLRLAGPELDGFDIGLPASSVRLLVPGGGPDGPAGADEPIPIPTWNGNEFLWADGARPAIRTLTPIRFDASAAELDVEVVLHGGGPLATWAGGEPLGDRVAVAGTGRGYTIDPEAQTFLLGGDESAIPAIAVLLDALPAAASVRVVIEAVEPVATVALPDHPGATVTWAGRDADGRPGDALGAAIASAVIDATTRVWVAGEAAAVHRIRQHLFDERGVARAHAVVRGYWKVGRGGDVD